jgi:hypothetical protein
MIFPASLRPWFWMLGWLLFFFLIALVIHTFQSVWRGEIVRDYAEGKYFKSSSSAPSILVLGDSLVGTSFPEDTSQPYMLGESDRWARIWLPLASYGDYSPLFGKPLPHLKLVVINLGTMNREFFSDDMVRTAKLFIKTAYLRISYGKDYAEKIMEHENVFQFIDCRPLSEKKIKRRVKKLKKYYEENSSLSPEAIRFLKLLKKSADFVVVVRLPKAQVLENKVKDLEATYQQGLSEQLRREGVPLIQLGEPLAEEFYCDGSHPNDRGVAIRSEQLQKLVKEVQLSTL